MDSLCKIDGCNYPAKSKGWCQAHYMRWFLTGDVRVDVPVVRKPKGRGCSVEGCARKHSGKGFCEAHLRRFNRYGNPGPAEIEPRNPGAVCKIDGCESPTQGRGWCNAHYLRWRMKGDPLYPLPQRGPMWVGDEVTYSGLHIRLRNERGPASAHACVSCGNPAEHWAFDHSEIEPMYDPRGLPYTTDLARYQPMCQPCHRRMDAERTRVRGCSVDGCPEPHKARGMCNRHYRRHLQEVRNGEAIG